MSDLLYDIERALDEALDAAHERFRAAHPGVDPGVQELEIAVATHEALVRHAGAARALLEGLHDVSPAELGQRYDQAVEAGRRDLRGFAAKSTN